jgi:hypothetical protein
MISHLSYTLFAAVLLAGASALTGERPLRERLGAAAYTLISCVLVLFAGSWLMYWIHG